MQIRRELVSECGQALDRFIADYFERTIAPRGQPPLEMDWETYKRIELANALVIFTARDDGKLRGFVMYVLAKHPHHKGMRFATCDIIAVDPDYRGMGIARSLIEYAEEQFKRYVYNVQAVIHNYRTIYDVEPLFEKMGFHNVESVYMKVL